jgi:hypothetical protein
MMSSRDAIMLSCLLVGRVAETTPRCLEIFTVTNNKNLQRNYEMKCNIEEKGGQIVESSNGENVIRAPVKDVKEWQD